MQKVLTLGLKELPILVHTLKDLVKEDCIILLRGDLASGKTTFVKEYVKSIGIKEEVTSPTFLLQSIYDDRVFHYDVYNKSLEEFISLGLLEEFEKEGLHFVEWGDEKLEKILKEYGFNTMSINILKSNDKRQYTINA
ncbi:MAG: tRNA (adenosine(37)-N6)-threonylcarbamoyltransferase complex ATPase subunit type 1 TsaE [Campylobacteraceae bacterium]|nr:tRNA (adenosine(37)-N6)-threonylcarbamoyltransferase complex ATPase subunit type 1 TsaE [Campylobacteraceae bacterium]